MAGSWLNLVAASSSTTRPASDRLASAGLAGLGPSRKSPNREVATAAVAAATARPVVSTRSRFRRVIAQALLQGGRGRLGGGAPPPGGRTNCSPIVRRGPDGPPRQTAQIGPGRGV